MQKYFLFIIFLLVSSTVFSQYETAHWFFGTHAGVDFNTGTPVRETGGQIDTEEGCSSISDPCGDLIMYTDGITIYNRNHAVMMNGTGLAGDPSSTQSGLIVPKPHDADIYYVFTVDAGFSTPSNDGMKYSVVNKTLDGGLGGVITGQKNITLVNHAGEKVTAVAGADPDTIWVITFAPRTTSTVAPYATTGSNFNTFYAFKVTNSGINTTAVVSQLAMNVTGGVGYLKVSPDGTKIGLANMFDHTAYLLDFDPATGIVTNPTSLFSFSADPYGLEFSPDSSKLYIGDRYNRVYQFDLSNGNARTTISTHPNYRSALQLGLDGKIYQTFTHDYGSGSNQLSVIENPNEPGTACHYRYRFINLGGGMECHQGLPPFIQSYFSRISGARDVSVGVAQNLELTSSYEIASVDWDFGDGSTATTYPDNPPDNTHTSASHLYTTTGDYTITANVHLLIGCDIIVRLSSPFTIYPAPIANLDDLVSCDDNQTGTVTLNLHDRDTAIINAQPSTTPGNYEIHYYPSQIDAENGTNELTDPYTTTTSNDEVFYSIYNQQTVGKTIGSFHIIIHPLPDVYNIPDYEICDNDTDGFAEFDLLTKVPEILNGRTSTDFEIHFYPTQNDAENDTNEITSPYTNQTSANETIWYKIIDIQSSCVNYGSLNLIVHPYQGIVMDDQFDLCTGNIIQIDAPNGYADYQWSTGETTQSIVVNAGGSYTLDVTDNNGCTYSKTITVTESDVAVIDNVDIVDFSSNNSITVIASGIGDYEYSIDNINFQDSNLFENLFPDTYTVYVRDKNGCGTVEKIVDLLGAPKFFTPNGDGYNDFWQIINVKKKAGTYVNIYDRYGKLLKVLFSGEQGWDGTYNGQAVLSTDYWYIVFVKEKGDNYRQVKGHFSLKR